MYALLAQDHEDPGKLDRLLDEPLPQELTAEQRRLAEIRRIADANRAGMAAIQASAGLPQVGR